MIFLTIATGLVGAVTALELIDPGIFSTAMPLPVAWAALLASWTMHGRRGWANAKFAPAARIALTVVCGLSTMPLVVFAVPTRLAAAIAPFAGLAVAVAVWGITDPHYADHPLQKNRAR